jgi:predicted RNA-binding Zn ribbon-like protein
MHHWTDVDLIGGHAALDFLNTVPDVGKSRQETRLATWQDYLNWLTAAKVERVDTANGIRVNRPATLAEIHDLRETGYSVFHDLAARKSPEKDTLTKLQDYIKDTVQHAQLNAVANELRWTVPKKDRKPHVHRLVLLIDDLLRSGDLHRLRECSRCTWLFLDTGRGLGRKWCDMRTCGNRAKSEGFRSKRSKGSPRLK